MRYYLIVVMGAFRLGACQGKKKEQASAIDMKSDTMYTCSMHPQVMQDRPGKCPICRMQLIPVKMGVDEEGTVALSDQQMRLGDIRVDTVEATAVGDRMVLSGTVTVDETRSSAVSARIGGRVERLYYKATGEYLHKGDK